MSMTLQQMRVACASRLDQALVAGDVPTTVVFWTRTELNEWLQAGYEHVYAQLIDVEAQGVEIEGTGTYTAGSRLVSVRTLAGAIDYDPLKLMGVYDITSNADGYGTPLQYMPYRQFESMSTPFDAGRVARFSTRAWTWTGHGPMNLAVFPIPTQALSLRVRFVPPLPSVQGANGTVVRNTTLNTIVAGNADTTGNIPISIPDNFHRVLVDWAIIRAKEKEESDTRRHEATLRERLSQLLLSADERQYGTSRMVHVTDGDESYDQSIY